jgi:hypothetical protein
VHDAVTPVGVGLMDHYVQYHNVEKYRHDAEDDSDRDTLFSIYAKKSVKRLPGNTVWLIAGEGRPRQYTLCEVFIVDEIGLVDVDDFRYFARGHHGTEFEPPIPLGQEPWFPGFLRHMGSFAWGLSRIPDKFLPYFQALRDDAES